MPKGLIFCLCLFSVSFLFGQNESTVRIFSRMEIKNIQMLPDTAIVEETRDTLGNILEEKMIRSFQSSDEKESSELQSTFPTDNLTYKYIDSTQTTETYHNGELVKKSRSVNFYDKKKVLQKVILYEQNLIDTTHKTETYYYQNIICVKIEKVIIGKKNRVLYKKIQVFYSDGVAKYIEEKNLVFPEKSTRTNYQYGADNFPVKIIVLDYKGKPMQITQWIEHKP